MVVGEGSCSMGLELGLQDENEICCTTARIAMAAYSTLRSGQDDEFCKMNFVLQQNKKQLENQVKRGASGSGGSRPSPQHTPRSEGAAQGPRGSQGKKPGRRLENRSAQTGRLQDAAANGYKSSLLTCGKVPECEANQTYR